MMKVKSKAWMEAVGEVRTDLRTTAPGAWLIKKPIELKTLESYWCYKVSKTFKVYLNS